jgi:hypothetical protein
MPKRQCRKCSNIIPNRIVIDGKQKNLQNRKFCLECSPWGKHNTSPHDPIERRKKAKYSEYSEKTKEIVLLSLYKRGLTRKSELVKMKGGGCELCGYNKTWRCLSFHHRNRDEKLFGLSLNNLWSKAYESILEEVEKCDLLCLNCHGEVEEGENIKNGRTIVQRVNEKYNTNF